MDKRRIDCTKYGGSLLNMTRGSDELAEQFSDIDYDSENMIRQKTERYIQDTGHRHTLILWMMTIVSLWLMAVIFIVAFNGLLNLSINDTVMVTLLATTTANVLGLPLIILKDLFKGLVQ